MSILTAVSPRSAPARVIEIGWELAQAFHEELVVLHVSPGDDDGAAPEAIARDIAEESLGKDMDGVVPEGRTGEPSEEIVDAASQRDVRYVVVGGQKRTPTGKAVFGSTTQSVLLSVDQAVVTVPVDRFTASSETATPIVACVDRTDRGERTVQEATAIADALDRPLHVVHVMTTNEFRDLEMTSVDRTDRTVPMEDVREMAASVAERAVPAEVSPADVVGLVGEPGQRIVTYASEINASYVVLAGRKTSPVGKVLFGSVTQSVLLNTDRPVLSIMIDE